MWGGRKEEKKKERKEEKERKGKEENKEKKREPRKKRGDNQVFGIQTSPGAGPCLLPPGKASSSPAVTMTKPLLTRPNNCRPVTHYHKIQSPFYNEK